MKKIIICHFLFLLFSLLFQAQTKPIYAQDTTIPVIITDCTTLDQDVFLQNQCELVVPELLSAIEATANIGTPTLIQSPEAGTVISSQQGATEMITITATDELGLTATCTITLTAKDTIAPTFVDLCSVADREVQLTNNCQLVVPDLTTSLTTTDNCDAHVSIIQQPLAGSILSSNHDNLHSVTLRAIDNAGFSTQCTVNLTAKDRIAPIILTDCAAIRPVVTLNDACQISIPDLRDDIIFSENCDKDVVITQTPAANSILAATITDNPTVIITATDAAGNSSECRLSLTIEDVTPPDLSFDCNSLSSLVVLREDCLIAIPNFVDSLTATDNCSAVTLTQFPAADSLTTLDADGTKAVIITAVDANGNETSCEVTLTAVDISPPTILTDCSELDWTANLTSNCRLIVPNFMVGIETAGGCSELTVTQDPLPGAAIESAHDMTHDIVITVADEAGLSNSCTILLIGRDRIAPQILRDCQDFDRDVILNENCAMIIPDLRHTISYADNCSDMATITQSPSPNSEVIVEEGDTQIVTLTVTDAAGQAAECTVNLTAKSSAEQLFGEDCGLTDVAIDLQENCEVIIPNLTSHLPTTVSCGLGVSYTQMPAINTVEASSHDQTHTVTITALFADNSTTSCTVTLVAQDNQAPIFTDCAAALTQEVALGENCQLTIPDLTVAEVVDNCSAITLNQEPVAGIVLESGHNEIHAVQLTATDEYGNSSTCEVLLTAKDKTLPTITTDCSTLNQTLALTADCQLVVPDLTGMITATDNCTNNLNIFQSPGPGMRLNSSHGQEHRIMILVMDEAENPRTCAVYLTGQDVTAPVAENCERLAQTVVLGSDCQAVIPDLTGLVVVTDNCDSEVTITQFPAAGQVVDAAHNDLIGVAFVLSDTKGNESTCATTLTAKDRTAPTPLPRNVFTTLNASGVAVITGAQLDGGSTDNCGIATFHAEPNTFTETGEYEVAFTVVDAAGNQQVSTVYVNVGEAPEPNALALALTNFTAQEKAGQTQLHWSISNAPNVAAYQVEWSIDAQTWMSLGNVATKSQQFNYEFTHTKPVAGWNYYRLQQIETDGSTEFSSTVDVQIGFNNNNDAVFYPNPTRGQLYVELSANFDSTLPIEVRIYDYAGQLIRNQLLPTHQPLDLTNLSTGLYQVELRQNDLRAIKRVLKMD